MTEKQCKWKEIAKQVGKGVLKYGVPTLALAGQIILAVNNPMTLALTGCMEYLGAVWFILRAIDKRQQKMEREGLGEDAVNIIARENTPKVENVGTIIKRAKNCIKEKIGKEFEAGEFLNSLNR